MENDEHPDDLGRWRYGWNSVLDQAFYAPIFVLLFQVLGVVQRDEASLAVARWGWTLSFIVLAPLLAFRVGRRRPPGDSWRAAACLAYGALPLPLLFLPALRQWPVVIVVPPLIIAWGVTAQLNAARFEPPPERPRVRAWTFAGAAVISGLGALPAFAAVVVGVTMAVWDPPDIAWLVSPLMVGLCLPLAAVCGWAAVRLSREAARAWRVTT